MSTADPPVAGKGACSGAQPPGRVQPQPCNELVTQQNRENQPVEQEGHPTQFLPVTFLFEEIQAARAAGRYLNYVRSLIKAKVSILDDLGLRNYTREEATSLMDILEERYRDAPLIVTSQVEPQGWRKLFDAPVIAEAIVDRLIRPCQKITLKGEKSYRETFNEKRSSLKNDGGLM
jgi:DNA replication protein DnaC